MTKNILFLLAVITAILTIGAGCVKRDIVDSQSDEVVSQELPTAQPSLPITCTEGQEGIPVITSLSSYAGPVGTKLEIKGCNFAGFEGDKNAWIENSQGLKGILYGEAGSTSDLLKITLKSPLCQKDVSYSGLPCDAPLILAPGIYKIYTMPWGGKSNKVIFTISSSAQSAQTAKPTNKYTATYLVSSEDSAKYCNGVDMDEAGYRKTIKQEKSATISKGDLTETELVKFILSYATVGVCKDTLRQLDIAVTDGAVYIPSIDGFTGFSIMMCSCRPQVEVNMLRIPGIQKVIWQ